MLTWCAVLFFLGVAAFLDSLFTFGEIFRRVNSVLFMLVSLGVLVRVSIKQKLGQRENYQERIRQLETEVKNLKEEKVKVVS
jgi:positive regulator of sigma E activity